MTDTATPTQRPWLLFIGWALVGLMWAFSLAGVMVVGALTLLTFPLTGVATWFMAHRKRSPKGLPGLFVTASLLFFYVTFLNFRGPGYVIVHIANGNVSLSRVSSPFIWLGIGAVFFVIGVIVFVAKTRQDRLTP